MKKILILLLIIIPFIYYCKNDKKNDNTINNNSNNVDSTLPKMIRVKDKVFSVPSPLQISKYINKEKINFDINLLNKPEKSSKYLTTFRQALNIGVYGADLGNLFVNDQLSESAKYFSALKNLADQVGVMNSINSNLLDRIDKNSQKKDSLIFLMSDIFKEIDNYLTENDQQNIGVLIIIGGWIESMYYLSSIAQTSGNPEIYNKIAEQKNPLNNIIALMQPFYNQGNDEFDQLHEKLVNLSIIFDSIEEIYVYKGSETDPKNKITIIKSTTTYNINKSQIKKIYEEVSQIRNWIVL